MNQLVEERPVDGAETPPETQAEGARPRSAGFRRWLLAGLVAVTVAGLVALAFLLSDRSVGAVGLQGSQDRVQADREAVMAQSEQFMLRMGTYGPDLLDSHGAMPTYRSRVKAVITPKFAVSFDKEAATAEQLVAQAHISRKAAVFATGVASIDSDSASVLVAGTFTDSYPKAGQQSVAREPSPFRIEVDLVKTGGRWLVDDFAPVTGGAAQ